MEKFENPIILDQKDQKISKLFLNTSIDFLDDIYWVKN